MLWQMKKWKNISNTGIFINFRLENNTNVCYYSNRI